MFFPLTYLILNLATYPTPEVMIRTCIALFRRIEHLSNPNFTFNRSASTESRDQYNCCCGEVAIFTVLGKICQVREIVFKNDIKMTSHGEIIYVTNTFCKQTRIRTQVEE